MAQYFGFATDVEFALDLDAYVGLCYVDVVSWTFVDESGLPGARNLVGFDDCFSVVLQSLPPIRQ